MTGKFMKASSSLSRDDVKHTMRIGGGAARTAACFIFPSHNIEFLKELGYVM